MKIPEFHVKIRQFHVKIYQVQIKVPQIQNKTSQMQIKIETQLQAKSKIKIPTHENMYAEWLDIYVTVSAFDMCVTTHL